MNGTPTFTTAYPLAKVIEEGEAIVLQTLKAGDDLEYWIAEERTLYGHYKDALDNYEISETDYISEALIQAQLKEGPLANIATTSKAYDLALQKLKNDIRRDKLPQLWKQVDQLRRNYENAQIGLSQAQTRLSALRHVADLKANILRASTI